MPDRTGAQQRAIDKLRKRPGTTVEIVDENHERGVHIRVFNFSDTYERIILPSGLGEEPMPDLKEIL